MRIQNGGDRKNGKEGQKERRWTYELVFEHGSIRLSSFSHVSNSYSLIAINDSEFDPSPAGVFFFRKIV